MIQEFLYLMWPSIYLLQMFLNSYQLWIWKFIHLTFQSQLNLFPVYHDYMFTILCDPYLYLITLSNKDPQLYFRPFFHTTYTRFDTLLSDFMNSNCYILSDTVKKKNKNLKLKAKHLKSKFNNEYPNEAIDRKGKRVHEQTGKTGITYFCRDNTLESHKDKAFSHAWNQKLLKTKGVLLLLLRHWCLIICMGVWKILEQKHFTLVSRDSSALSLEHYFCYQLCFHKEETYMC